jgi:hypothetical protein
VQPLNPFTVHRIRLLVTSGYSCQLPGVDQQFFQSLRL